MARFQVVITLVLIGPIFASSIQEDERGEDHSSTGSIFKSNHAEGNDALFQGDINMESWELEDVKKHHVVDKRNVLRSRKYLWTDRIIPYVIDSSLSQAAATIKDALYELEKHTCLRFVPRTYQGNYINYKYLDGCWSRVGKIYWKEAEQEISLGKGCDKKGTIIHETMHALGFWHEQSRPDRRNYVKVLWENIQDGMEDQFDRYSDDYVNTLGLDYDLDSIMHYGKKSFSVDGVKQTLEAIGDPTRDLGGNTLTNADINKINAVYDCGTTSYGWTQWSSFTPCDVYCRKERQRYCYHYGNKKMCGGAVNDYGIESQIIDCTTAECPIPRDGHWSRWSKWGDCSVTCNDGKRERTRKCDDPAPMHGGKDCIGDDILKGICVMPRCRLDFDDTEFTNGNMGMWSAVYSGFKLQWKVTNLPTNKANTGVFSDHTDGKGYYLLMDTASAVAGDKARIESYWMSGGTPQCLKLHYSMHGSSQGSLRVVMKVPGNPEWYILYLTGDQGPGWKYATANVDVTGSYMLAIEAVAGGNWYSDVTIDDIYLDNGPCDCQDTYFQCVTWHSKGECTKNPTFMNMYCKKTCGVCSKYMLKTAMILTQDAQNGHHKESVSPTQHIWKLNVHSAVEPVLVMMMIQAAHTGPTMENVQKAQTT
uniref:Metalloendopeptidase n=1 Tax=Pachycerianthus maua TaxID=2736681 RepID=A0A7G7WYS9_9CNID|nr:toxin candidate TRINITY_DN34308_c0_g1_i1 [Pachycerianthus maua]